MAPENTLAAFHRAIEDGADGVEFDVRLSGDGIPVVIHDATLPRTGLRAGTVAGMTAVDLGQIDAGTWFSRVHPELAQDHYSRERIASLEKVLQVFTTSGDRYSNARLYIELKSDRAGPPSTELAREVVRALLERRVEQRAVLLSFDLQAIAEARRISSEVQTGALFKPGFTRALRKEDLISLALRSGANEIALHRLLARRGLVNVAVQHGLKVVVWTVNNPQWLTRTRTRGVHAIITDDPRGMLASRQSRA